jgi:tryptophanyl-tRNA synthetase
LLYKTNIVPVGEDQIQHVELSRDLAQRFNNHFGEVFVVPKAVVKKEGARIMGLDDPVKKMSKSAGSIYNYIALTDAPDLIRDKIKKAMTDSGKEIIYSKDKPALANLLTIYSLCSGRTIKEIEKYFADRGYADFKTGLVDAIIKFLAPFQKKYIELKDEDILKILQAGAQQAQTIASQTMAEVKKVIGLIG